MNAGTKYIKFEMPSSKKKKISTAEHAETAEDFLPKGSKHEFSNDYCSLSAFSATSAVKFFLNWETGEHKFTGMKNMSRAL